MASAWSSHRIGRALGFDLTGRELWDFARFRRSGDLVWRNLASQYLLPIGLLLALGLGGLFVVLIHLTGLQDSIERRREIGLVANSIEGGAAAAANNLSDFAIWDEAVRHIVIELRQDWILHNIDSYGLKTQGYRWISIVDGADRPVAPSSGLSGESGERDPGVVLGDAYRHHRQALRDSGTLTEKVITGFSRSRYGLFTYSAAYVLPSTPALPRDAGRGYLMTIAANVDEAFLQRLAVRHHLQGMRLTNLAPGKDEAFVRLNDAAGNALGWITWDPQHPGSDLRWQVLPAFLLVGVVCVLAAALILQRARGGLDALRISEARAQYLAGHDMLTDLPNRRAMITDLRARLSGSVVVTLLYMDLDGFKEVNDIYGHGIGDEVLRQASARIRRAAGPAAMVARIGGDEFAVVRAGAANADAIATADAILAVIHDPIEVQGFRLRIGTSIGIADSSDIGGHAETEEEIVRRADLAMYAAKGSGKNRWRIYDPASDRQRTERKILEQDLRTAIDRRALTVSFQPVVDAPTRRIIAAEARARWTRAGEVLPVEQFLTVAEESGLIIDLGRQLLEDACRQACGWDVSLSVNISPTQFWDRDLPASIAEILARTGFPGDRLELELNESYLLRRPRAALLIIEELRRTGVHIAIDEFGRSFGSIGFLRELSIDRIKIDRTLVKDVTRDDSAAEMARSVVAIGRSLGLPVTAEGIEREGQAAIMHAAGCDRLQGCLFGHPLDGEALDRLLGKL